MRTTVVTTTIHVPHFLSAYSEDARRFGHEVDFIVIGDRKSPVETADFCATIPDCVYMDIEAQREYMLRFPELWSHLPFDSFERRMIGILRAYETGADVMVTIDDDNLLATEDALSRHKIVGITQKLAVFRSTSGWFNICSFLKEENGVEFYHRGYSPRNRWDKTAYVDSQFRNARVVVNAGLWYNNPDTDAITRLERKLNVTGFYVPDSDDTGSVGLAPGTWSPFNCQNTAIAREAIPAYFLSPHIGRHSDIFASYVIARLAEHFGDVIAFGMPLANHARDTYPHSLWHDFDIERWGMENTDAFCDALRNIKIVASTYHVGFGQIIDNLSLSTGSEEWAQMVKGMRIWHETFKKDPMKKALVIGCTGQDGSYLCELLLEKGYQVWGSLRRSSSFNTGRIDHIFQYLHLRYADLTDAASIENLVIESKPDEVYNLGAQSHVKTSFDIPEYTADATAVGALHMLQSVRAHVPEARFYQASSSEMFGSTPPPQDETTVFHPRSPYGVAKVYAHNMTVNFREGYGLHASCGILFNHESPRRGDTFVTKKIVNGAVNIYQGLQGTLRLGNLDAKRDWGYAPEYVQGMHLMLQQDKPDDYVLATGETHTIREFCEETFSYLGMDYEKYVEIDPKYYRPAEVDVLQGDASKARRVLGWEPRVRFKELVRIMVDAEMRGEEPVR